MDLTQIWCEVDWIKVAESKVQWWALVKTVINLRVALEGDFSIS